MDYEYRDKNGDEIKAGMKIRHDNGEVEEVYATEDGYGNDNLGINATNPDYAARHPDHEPEYYPLWSFDLSEWEIVK